MNLSQTQNPKTLLPALRIGCAAARANLVPGLILQAAAAFLLLSYYNSPTLRDTLHGVENLKMRWGPLYTFLSAATFCGLLPWLFRIALPGLCPRRPWAELLFGLLYWGAICQVTDQFYQFQAWLWGELVCGSRDANHPWVIAVKTACDMLLFTPAIAAPCNAISHLWKDRDFSFSKTRQALRGHWYRDIVMPSLVPNWVIWTPGIALTYALPQPLQLPMANLIGCFWALLCITIASKTQTRNPAV
ncbi:MAG: hypothetical protein LBG65_08595 [Puniceicoccales bacterium]|jgi:hypothetical protein|nr:hypothetical protein [Puniceicoccales bacterium]